MQKKEENSAKVGVVYLAKPVLEPAWPYPHFDPNEDIKKIDKILKGFENKWDFDIEFIKVNLIRDKNGLKKSLKKLEDIDGLLVFNLSTGVSHLIKSIVDSVYPSVLFSQPYSGHDWAEVVKFIRDGKKIDIISSSDFNNIEPFARIFHIIRKLKTTKILYIKSKAKKTNKMIKWEGKYGVKIKTLDFTTLNKFYNSIDIKEAQKEAEKFIEESIKIVEPSKEEIIKSLRLYLGVKKLLLEEKANAITIDCFGALYGEGFMPAYPCVAWSKLNDEGLIGVCEADINSLMTQLIVGSYSDIPGFVNDPVFDTKTNTVIAAHCVAPTKMHGVSEEASSYIIRSHAETAEGVSLQVKMPIRESVTLAEFIDLDTLVFYTGKTIGNPDSERGCRTKVAVKVDNAERCLYNYSGGLKRLHRVFFYGDYTKAIKSMGRLIGFKVIEEGC